ncbi:alpha-amylase family protein [Kineococcus sp. SYSU DK002]|uniref:alpha-amylase family protein n=1 Tax=Kineococcus sp. SYSU DK002 TaxID=3383123 RepID=UPI003D7C5FF9
MNWWDHPFRTFQTNLREIDANLDVDAVVKFITGFGADAWLLNTGGIISNYPTDLEFQTRNPVLVQRPSGDLVGDAVTAAHAAGVRLLCRMDFSKVAPAIADAHPDWCFRGPDGHRQEYSGLVSVCPDGGYYQQGVQQVLDEIVDRYPVDGFFFNWFSFNEVDYSRTYHGVCHCDACVDAYRAWGGGELPTGRGAEGYPRWRVFARERLDELNRRLHDHLKARRPDVALIQGQHSDVVFHEANNAVGRDLWPTATGEAVSVARTHRPDVPVFVNSVAFVDMPYRLASEEPHTFAQYLVQAVSRSGYPSTYVMGTPDVIPYAVLDGASAIVRFHREHHDVYDGLRPAAPVGVVRPDPLRTHLARAAAARAEFEGLYLAAQRRQVPVDVLAEERLLEVLAGEHPYRVLVLGDLGPLPPGLVDALEDFVARGGRLLLTGSTGFRDGAQQIVGAGIGVVADLVQDEERLRNSYSVDPADVDQAAGAVRGRPVPVLGALHRVRARAGVEVPHRYLAPAPFGPPEKCYGGELSADATTVRAPRVTTIPWTVGRAHREVELSLLADHVAGELRRLLAGDAPVVADLPERVEITLGRNRSSNVAHLVNLTGAGRRNFGPPSPVRGSLRIPGLAPGTSVRTLVAGTAVTADATGTAELPVELELFEVVLW